MAEQNPNTAEHLDTEYSWCLSIIVFLIVLLNNPSVVVVDVIDCFAGFIFFGFSYRERMIRRYKTYVVFNVQVWMMFVS